MKIRRQDLLQLCKDLCSRSCVENSQDPVRINSWEIYPKAKKFNIWEKSVQEQYIFDFVQYELQFLSNYIIITIIFFSCLDSTLYYDDYYRACCNYHYFLLYLL